MALSQHRATDAALLIQKRKKKNRVLKERERERERADRNEE